MDFGSDTPGTKNAAIGFSNNMKITRAEATLNDIQDYGFSVWGGYEGNTVFDGRKVTFKNSAWSYIDTEYWTYNTYDFHGVYPTPVANSTDKNYTVTWNNTTKELKIENFDASNNIDLLHAHTPVDNQNGQSTSPVTMNFNHILTNVNVELIQTDANDEIVVTGIGINLPTKGDYNWQETNYNTQQIRGAWITYEDSYFLVRNENLNVRLSDNQYAKALSDLLCIPQTINKDEIYLFVRYDYKPDGKGQFIKDNVYTVALPSGKWNIGDKVVYRGSIDADMQIFFGTPTIEDWGEDMAGGTIIIK
jgi:hypothetical protein